jgi:hypothetical protein
MPSAAVTSITQPPDHSTGHILGKRSIQELVAQVNPTFLNLDFYC